MYKKVTLKEFKELKKSIPEDMSFWLTEETVHYLKVNICPEDLDNVKAIIYRDFIKKNPWSRTLCSGRTETQ